jgi:hypothetical protein
MIIESTLTRQEFTRHALSRHFRRPGFCLYSVVCAVLTAYAFFQPSPSTLLLLAAWLPFLIYCISGWVTISRRSRDANLPLYLPTRYEFTARGVEMSSRQGRVDFAWDRFRSWRKVVGVYELTLTNGQILVISERALSQRQARSLEQMLNQRIKPKPEPGVFDTLKDE